MGDFDGLFRLGRGLGHPAGVGLDPLQFLLRREPEPLIRGPVLVGPAVETWPPVVQDQLGQGVLQRGEFSEEPFFRSTWTLSQVFHTMTETKDVTISTSNP